MKRQLILALGVVVALSITAGGQDVATLSQVTLYSKMGHNEWSRTSINFDSGERGSPSRTAKYDLSYGNLVVNNYPDWFEVRDPRSMIIDLGAQQWGDFKETPPFFKGKKPRKPLPLSRPKVLDASAGVKEHSPYQQFVRVEAGHMYLMKVMRERQALYVMFRVDSLSRVDNCILSWKKVPPPLEDFEK